MFNLLLPVLNLLATASDAESIDEDIRIVVGSIFSGLSIEIQYLLYIAIIVVGFLILAFLNRTKKYPLSEKIKRTCISTLNKVEALKKELKSNKNDKGNDYLKIYTKLKVIMYDVTDIIEYSDLAVEQEKDSAYESIKLTMQVCQKRLNSIKKMSVINNKNLCAILNCVIEDFNKALDSLNTINQRNKLIGA